LLIHIGEILNALKKYHQELSFTDADSIRWMRNILAHQYISIRKGYIIKALFDHLPVLKQETLSYLHAIWDPYVWTRITFIE
jgi:uncharacterized protein with HEPN domain